MRLRMHPQLVQSVSQVYSFKIAATSIAARHPFLTILADALQATIAITVFVSREAVANLTAFHALVRHDQQSLECNTRIETKYAAAALRSTQLTLGNLLT